MDSIGQNILDGLNVSLIGMTITIASLICLSLLIVLMSKMIVIVTNKFSGRKDASAAPGSDSSPRTDAPLEAGKSDSISASGLIAIFAAAIAQSTGAEASSFRVVTYRKTGQNAPVWNISGRSEYLAGKL